MAHRSGGIISEAILEDNLERAGYTIFHPERHPLDEQIAQYKAARRILSLDGSALHLTGFVVTPNTKVGIILRRSKLNLDDYVDQFKGFAGIDPVILDCVQRDRRAADRPNQVSSSSMGEIDFSVLFADLREQGFIDPAFKEVCPTSEDV